MEEVITELEDITPKISFNLEVLKEELDLTSKEVALVKKAIADFSPRVGTNSKVKIPNLLCSMVQEMQRNLRISFGTSMNTSKPPRSQRRHMLASIACTSHQTPNFGGILEYWMTRLPRAIRSVPRN